MAQKSAAERQRECRERKKKEGRYVSIFVPNEIYEKIKGRPRLLIENFHANEELISIIVTLEKKHIALTRQMKEFVREARVLEKELSKIYRRKRIRTLYDIRYNKQYWAAAENKLNQHYEGPWALYLYKDEVNKLKRDTKSYIETLKSKWSEWYSKINQLKDELTQLFIDPRTRQQKEIERHVAINKLKAIEDLCWELYKDKLRFDMDERKIYYSLLKKFEFLESFDSKKLPTPANTQISPPWRLK